MFALVGQENDAGKTVKPSHALFQSFIAPAIQKERILWSSDHGLTAPFLPYPKQAEVTPL